MDNLHCVDNYRIFAVDVQRHPVAGHADGALEPRSVAIIGQLHVLSFIRVCGLLQPISGVECYSMRGVC